MTPGIKTFASVERTRKGNSHGNSPYIVSYRERNFDAKSLLKENICSHQYSYEDWSQEGGQASYGVHTRWEKP